MKLDIVFVILHYQVMDETLRCIESIRRYIDTSSYHIIVVDNASLNQSGIALKKHFEQSRDVRVILNKENLGFSKGNNVGYRVAKKMNCRFLCMMNNDTELIQDDFFKRIENEYQHSQFAVLGPQIHLKDDRICAYPKHILKLCELNDDRIRTKRLLLKNKLFLESLHLFLYKYVGKVIQWKKIRHHFRNEEAVDGYMENVRLHGCCMIFSEIYLQAFDGLEERTYFYGEEEVLFVRLIRHHMKSVYDPSIRIKHLEEAATSALNGKDYKKRRFIYEKHLEILDMLEALYKEDLNSLKDYI